MDRVKRRGGDQFAQNFSYLSKRGGGQGGDSVDNNKKEIHKHDNGLGDIQFLSGSFPFPQPTPPFSEGTYYPERRLCMLME